MVTVIVSRAPIETEPARRDRVSSIVSADSLTWSPLMSSVHAMLVAPASPATPQFAPNRNAQSAFDPLPTASPPV